MKVPDSFFLPPASARAALSGFLILLATTRLSAQLAFLPPTEITDREVAAPGIAQSTGGHEAPAINRPEAGQPAGYRPDPSGLASPAIVPADLVLTNGNIITLAAKGDRAEALAIRGNRILAVGDTASIRKYIGPATKIIDLRGQTLVPGFNDVHQHPAPIYAWDKPYAILRLDTVSSMQNLIDLLKRKAAITPKGMLIRGVAYNEMKLGGQPTREFLDKASSDHPILITHASGHLSAANSLLLRENGIGKDTKDPPGGALERDAKGEPDGIIKESARSLLHAGKTLYPPKPGPEEELDGYRLYFHALLASGLTSIGDCWTTPQKVDIYRQLVSEKFPMRFNCYIGYDYLDQVIDGRIKRQSTDFLRIEGIKIFHGNSLSGKTCWLYDPYDTINPVSGKKDYYGIPPARSQAGLDSLVLKIHQAGLQIACHSNGDREIEMVIAAIEKAQLTAPRPDARHRIEHCSITNTGILERIKKDSIIPVFHSYANELGTQLLVYGPKRIAMLMPTKTARDMGIVFAMHSDYPISRYEPMLRLDGAVNRMTKNGVVIGANQRIDAEDAIKAYTVGGAWTTHEEHNKGSIVAGQLADLVVLDQDPTTIDPGKIASIQVNTTILDGQVVYQR
ncbi:MAG: amidohydrolase [Puia sp.]|nr:amidohydrolase [Puia sp.]